VSWRVIGVEGDAVASERREAMKFMLFVLPTVVRRKNLLCSSPVNMV
jgi:hypothetical protein